MDFPLFFLINLIRILKYAILIRVLLSWVSPMGQGGVQRFFAGATEPVLKVFRAITPNFGMMDLSPLFAFFAFDLLEYGILRLMAEL